jgi:phosphonate transport system permease protein
MNQRIEEAYSHRPKDWVYNSIIIAIVAVLIIWSASAIETSGTTSDGVQIAIARQKAGIRPGEKVSLQRFEVVRHT